jgi:VWFA-related protein
MATPTSARWRRSTAGLALALASAVATGQTAAPPETSPFSESVNVEVVEVEVYVSDAHGAPIAGLAPSDFTLTIDGERRDLAGFFEGAARSQLSAPSVSTVTEPSVATPAATPAPSLPERRLSLAVLLDELHMQPAARKRTLERVAAMLDERIAAGDQVMVATLDRSLRVRRAFDETSPIADSLKAIEKHAPGGIHTEIDRRQTMSTIRDLWASQGCQALAQMQAIGESWTQQVEHESRTTLSSMTTLLAALGGRSGRKALLVVSEGMSLTPGLEAKLLIEELCPGQPGGATTGLVNELHAVTRAANAAQATLYTLDAGGQRVLASAVDAGPGLSMADQSAIRADTQDPEFALASDTGGKALIESNKPEILVAELAQDLAAYYSLAFTPRPADAGRAHRIKVEVARPSARVRYRSSWEPVPPAAALEGRVVAALKLGGGADNPLSAELTAGAAHREADGGFTVPLRLEVPASGLVLLPQGDRRRGRLLILLGVADSEGRTTPVRSLPLAVDLPALAPEADDIARVPLEVRLKLRQGRNTIVVAVHDEGGTATSLLRREVMVGR